MDFSKFNEKQESCIRELGPLLVPAGAGSGKTFMLTNRIAYALETEEHPEIDHIEKILAITFTEKAAAEIKSRVRATLRELGSDQARLVDSAWISTMHGMCERILRIHALEVGLDPDFEVLDSVKQQQLLNEAFDEVLSQGLIDGAQIAALNREYGTKDTSSTAVKPMVFKLLHESQYLPEGIKAFEIGPEPASPSGILRALAEAYEYIEATGTAGQKTKAQISLEVLNDFLLQSSRAWIDVEKIIRALERPQGGGSEDQNEAVHSTQQLLDKLYSELNLSKSYEFMRSLLLLAQQVKTTYEAKKKTQNSVDLGGLIPLVLDIFEQFPAIAKRYQDQFELIMVDEFQDTNQLQIKLIEKITQANNSNLCTVGDSQQSIYQFQGADVKVYNQHKKDMSSSRVNAQRFELDENFRSHADVLAFVKQVCGQLNYFSEDFLDLSAGRDEERVVSTGSHYKSETPRIDVMMTAYPWRSTQAAKQIEAQAIADRFVELRDAGHRGSEMVLLLGAMTNAHLFAEAFRTAGFQCIITGGSGFFDAEEVKTIGYLLRALANPADSEALYQVLAGDMFCLSDDDFILLGTAYKEGELCREDIGKHLFYFDCEQPSELLSFAQQVMQKAWESVGKKLPSEVALDVLIDSGWLMRLQDEGIEGQAVAGNLLKALRFIKKLEAEPLFDMAQVAQKFTQLQNDKEKPGSLMTGDQDAIRIMTVHSSKGLEFPIVAVADCDVVQDKEEQLLIMKDRDKGYCSLKPKKSIVESPVNKKKYGYEVPQKVTLDTADFQADFRGTLIRDLKEDSFAEKKRLLYVALTRASEAIVFSMRVKKNKDGLSCNSVQNVISTALFGAENSFPENDASIEYGGSEPLRYRFYSSEDAEEVEREGQTKTFKIIEPPSEKPCEILTLSQKKELFSYTSLSANEDVPSNTYYAEAPTDADKATDFGSAFHSVAELAILSSPDNARARIDEIAQAYGVVDKGRLSKAAECWFASDTFKKTEEYDLREPEAPFCVPLETTSGKESFLEGEIDLLCSDADRKRAFVVDYKTGGSAEETPEALHKKHLFQAQCYAYALLYNGYEEVEFVFARVERLESREEMQVVTYSFAKRDQKTLCGAIVKP